jgi:hypothetical protein
MFGAGTSCIFGKVSTRIGVYLIILLLTIVFFQPANSISNAAAVDYVCVKPGHSLAGRNGFGRTDRPRPPLTGVIFAVRDSKQFIRAVKSAVDGDTIKVADGVYDLGTLVITKRVLIFGESLWGGVIKGTSLLDIRADGLVIDGLAFEDGASVSWINSRDHSLYVRSHNVTVSNNKFFNVGINSNVSDRTGITIEALRANNLTIRNNLFTRSRSIAIKTDDYSHNLVVIENDFIDSKGFGGAGEVVQVGDALSLVGGESPSADALYATIARNYINNWTLESELISIKSDSNKIIDNRIENSGSSAIVIRMGNNNYVAGNIVTENERFPIRVSGNNNLIEGNYFSGSGDFFYFHNEIKNLNKSANINYQYKAAKNNTIKENIYDGYVGVQLNLGIKGEVSAHSSGNKFLNNIIFSDGDLLNIDDRAGVVFLNNINRVTPTKCLEASRAINMKFFKILSIIAFKP